MFRFKPLLLWIMLGLYAGNLARAGQWPLALLLLIYLNELLREWMVFIVITTYFYLFGRRGAFEGTISIRGGTERVVLGLQVLERI